MPTDVTTEAHDHTGGSTVVPVEQKGVEGSPSQRGVILFFRKVRVAVCICPLLFSTARGAFGADGASISQTTSTTGELTGRELRQLRRDREAMRDDRVNIRHDERQIQSDRQDIRAAEHDIKINPQNTAADQVRIAADRQQIGRDRQDMQLNRQDMQRDHLSAERERAQLRQQSEQSSSGSNPGLGTTGGAGFFGPKQNHKPTNVGSANAGFENCFSGTGGTNQQGSGTGHHTRRTHHISHTGNAGAGGMSAGGNSASGFSTGHTGHSGHASGKHAGHTK